MNRKDQEDEARALLAIACLWDALREAKDRRNLVEYREWGGHHAEELLHALDTGSQHPLLQKWEARKPQNRSPPSLHDERGRRQVVLLRLALEQAGLSKGRARREVAAALQRKADQIGFSTAASVTAATIRYWEKKLRPPLGPEDEVVIKAALERCGTNHARLMRDFLGLVEYLLKPLPASARWK